MTNSDLTTVPVPVPTPTSAPFWEALRRGELHLQRCARCLAWVYYPRVRCPTCLSNDLQWQPVDPVGTVYSFTVATRPTAPMFQDEVPQVIAIVELAIGVRITTTLVVDDPAAVHVGLAVTGVFDPVADDITLLRFRPTADR
jgi:uncharacterized OB-fold protein